MTRPSIVTIGLAALAAVSAAGEEPAADPLRFSAVGCGPYSAADAAAARFYIAQETRDGSSHFLVHLGDICTGRAAREGELTEENYSMIRELLTRGNSIPTYIVPGDNEWNDRPNPAVGWVLWNKHLLGLEKNFESAWETTRQGDRPENFAFLFKDVLIIGINLPGGRIHDQQEWLTRFRDNNDWIEEQFAEHGGRVKAAVVCCQANVIGFGTVKLAVNTVFKPFSLRFGKIAAEFGKPVLFLHADGHKWLVDHPWEEAPKVTRVQVDRLEPRFAPVQITVDPSSDETFQFDRRLDDPAWSFKQSAAKK